MLILTSMLAVMTLNVGYFFFRYSLACFSVSLL